MDEGESSALKNRKRTESNGGSSDSELSEGWNIIDQTDVTSQDVPSSDGESVEVIDAEDESRGNVTDTDIEGDNQLSPVSDTGLVSSSEDSLDVQDDGPQGTHREEMFDSSFCWFLFFATSAVLLSNLAFMVAENAFAWNVDVSIEAPSFLRDLPTTPKLMDGSNLIQSIPWAEKDEIMVEVLDDHIARRDHAGKYDQRSSNYEANRKQPFKEPVKRFEKHINKKPYESSSKQENRNFNKEQSNNYYKQTEKLKQNKKERTYEIPNDELQKGSLNFNDQEIGRYFNSLTEVTTSTETREKLNHILLILDALHIGLSDLEEIVTDNSELHDVLKKQKQKLSQILTEMEYGISKSVDRVATNILNKVHKLERRFENQWCDLEKRGHREELKGLFYDCPESENNAQSDYQSDSKHQEKIKPQIQNHDTTLKEDKKIDMNWNSFQYQVDKDSPGKDHSNTNTHGNEAKDVDDYYMLVKSEMQNNVEFSTEHINSPINHESKSERKESLPTQNNNENKYDERKNADDRNDKGKEHHFEDKGKKDNFKDKHHDYKRKHDERRNHNSDKGTRFDEKAKYDDKGKHDVNGKHYKKKYVDNNGKFSDWDKKHNSRKSFSDDRNNYAKKLDTSKTFESTEHHDYNYKDQEYIREEEAKSEKFYSYNSEPELIRRYLKESCDKGRKKLSNMYEKLKSFIDSKLRVPKKMFDSLFTKYCGKNDDSFKWEKRFNRENPKGDFSGKNEKNIFKDEFIIEDVNKNVRMADISEVSPEDKAADTESDTIILPNSPPRQWVFNYQEPLHDNKSNITGYWFFKAGESRSKMRWSRHRGDWWFERASHRRTHPRPPNWYSERHKNWYFRRAWARQNCRQYPHYDWCDPSEDETVTVPNPGFNFR